MIWVFATSDIIWPYGSSHEEIEAQFSVVIQLAVVCFPLTFIFWMADEDLGNSFLLVIGKFLVGNGGNDHVASGVPGVYRNCNKHSER